MNARRALFVSPDGFHHALGRSQIYPYLHGLAERGHHIDLVTYEAPGTKLRYRELVEPRFHWTSLRYFPKRVAPLNVLEGAPAVTLLGLAAQADLVHARAFFGGIMLLPLIKLRKVPLLMDTRGFWFDEKADVGSLPRDGKLYPLTKKVELELYQSSSAITVLTVAAREYLRAEYPHRDTIRAPIHVIPTCVDLELFSLGEVPESAVARDLADELRGRKAVVYSGSLGTFYMEAEMAAFYAGYKRTRGEETAFLLLTAADPEPMRKALNALGLGADLVVRRAKRAQMPAYLRMAEAALSFIKPTFSKVASAPTKVGEYLACGLPVAANDVGDMKRVVTDEVGVLVDIRGPLGEQGATFAKRVASGFDATAALAQAKRWFSLERALDAYAAIYAAMPQRSPQPCGARENLWPPP